MMFKPPPRADEESHDHVCVADWVELNLLAGDVSTVSVLDVIDELTEIPPDDADESERRFEREEFEQEHNQETTPGYWKSAEDLADSAFAELSERMAWLGGPLSARNRRRNSRGQQRLPNVRPSMHFWSSSELGNFIRTHSETMARNPDFCSRN